MLTYFQRSPSKKDFMNCSNAEFISKVVNWKVSENVKFKVNDTIIVVEDVLTTFLKTDLWVDAICLQFECSLIELFTC